MSNNTTISEGATGRNFAPVDKLKVNNSGGGNSLWVENSASSSELYVTENGVYIAPSNDVDAYTKVYVRVEDQVEWEDVDPTNEEELWDLESLEEFEDDPDSWNDKFNDKDKYKNKDKKIKTKKEKKVTGTDQDDENAYEVGLDENGDLTVGLLPSAIKIVVPPTKLIYQDGDTIDFSGIHVYLMDANETKYTDAQYPTGEILFNELYFPVLTAEGGSSERGKYSSLIDEIEGIKNPVPIGFIELNYRRDYTGFYQIYTVTYSTNALAYTGVLHSSGNYFYDELLIASKVEGSYVTRKTHIDRYNSTTGVFIESSESINGPSYATYSYTYNGKTVYYTNLGVGQRGVSENDVSGSYVTDGVYNGNIDGTILQKIAWTMVYGEEESADIQIPVQWTRSDGKTLEDTFEITISSGEQPQPEPQPDPYANAYDFEFNGVRYNINRKVRPAVNYDAGTNYVTQADGLVANTYTLEQAVKRKLIFVVG